MRVTALGHQLTPDTDGSFEEVAMTGRWFMVPAEKYNTQALLEGWGWRIPGDATPIFISAMGDWIFGDPDGSWAFGG